MTTRPAEILAIPGSLRTGSRNRAALRAAAASAAPDGVAVAIDSYMGELPHFDPDLEPEPPDVVLRFRATCERAGGVLLAVPEYAFGIPGVFKNALDWTVGTTSLYGKPVTVLSVAPEGRGRHARDALANVLTAIGADAVYRSVPIATRDLTEDGEVADARIVGELRAVVVELAERARMAGIASDAGRSVRM
jgi:chromate reductase, NAD(P)H dehydrogenase (quinone)